MTTRKSAAPRKRAPARKTPQDHKPSLRDQLAKKRARIITEYFPLDDEGEAAVTELENLQGQLRLNEIVSNRQGEKSDVDLTGLRGKIAAAEKRRDETCLVLRVRGLSEDERDALASEFSFDEEPDGATEDEKRAIQKANADRIREWTYAALAVAAQDSDLTADEWRDELSSDRWTAGDMARIRNAISSAYGAGPANGIPKG